MHLEINMVIIVVVAILTAPLTMLVAALRDRIRAAPVKLAAEAAAIKNPVVRTLATEVAAEAPVVLAAAEKLLAASQSHVVAAVSSVNPQYGNLVKMLIDTALATPPDPTLSAPPPQIITNTTGGQP